MLNVRLAVVHLSIRLTDGKVRGHINELGRKNLREPSTRFVALLQILAAGVAASAANNAGLQTVLA
jgi:hypothetical protein